MTPKLSWPIPTAEGASIHWLFTTKARPIGIVRCQFPTLYIHISSLKKTSSNPSSNHYISSDVNYIEGQIPKEYGSDAKEIQGGRDILRALETSGAKWGVVTSGTRALISGWLEVLGLTHPENLVVAEDVPLGKPDPRCYLLGAKMIGLEDSKSVLVLEDAPSGIKAGKAAGYKVLALATTHSLDKLRAAGADWIVEDLRSLKVNAVVDGKVQVEISNALQ